MDGTNNHRSESCSCVSEGDCTKNPMLADVRVCPGRRWRCAVTATEHVIRWSTAGVVDGVPGAADDGRADLREFDGDAGLGAPQGDGSGAGTAAAWFGHWGGARGARAGARAGRAAVAAWRAVALVGSYELLMMVIRSSQAVPWGTSDSPGIPDPLQEQAAEIFADQLAADRVPSVRAIRAQLPVGQPRAQRLREFLAAETTGRAENPAA